MCPHPGLHPADTPDRDPLPDAQEAGNQHEGKTNDSADQPESSSPAHSLWSAQGVSDEYGCGQPQDHHAGGKPFLMCTVDPASVFSQISFRANATAWPNYGTASTWQKIPSDSPGARHHADRRRRNWARHDRGKGRRKSLSLSSWPPCVRGARRRPVAPGTDAY